MYVKSFPPTERRWQISSDGGNGPRWRGDGKQLYYLAGNRMMTADLRLGSTVEAPRPRGRFVRLCYDVVVRTTLDISDEAYYIAKAIARDQNRSLGRVVGDLILRSSKGAKGASIKMSDYGFPTFRCARPVTTEDVKALDDEE